MAALPGGFAQLKLFAALTTVASPTGPLAWVVFLALVMLLLALDLFVLQRGARTLSFRAALGWSAFWIGLAAAFNLWVWWAEGSRKALEFTTGYVVEESLSVDNLFFFLVLFQFFRIPAEYQKKVLTWGILGALAMRGVFIVAGVSLLERLEWIIYLFGAFLVYTGIRLAVSRNDAEPERNWLVRTLRRRLPVTENMDGGRFFMREASRRMVTPLLLALVAVESTDVLFAADSIPAVLAITRDPFIVFSSNIFAILGLRALYFALAGMMRGFHYLHHGLAVILIFIGAKMLISHFYDVPTHITLAVIGGVLGVAVVASWGRQRVPGGHA